MCTPLFARVVPKACSRQQQIICLGFCVQSFIPKSLDQVEDYERDQQRLACGKDTEGIYYQTITGLKADLSGVRQGPSLLEDPTSAQPSSQNSADLRSTSHDDSGQIEDDTDSLVGGDDDEFGVILVKDLKEEPACVAGDNNAIIEGSEEDSSDDEDDEEGPSNDPKKEAARLARKEHKKKVKAEKRESRKVKVPKAQKKKKKKLAKAKCTR